MLEGGHTHQAHSGVCLHLFIYGLTQGLPHELLLCCCMRSCNANSCGARIHSVVPILFAGFRTRRLQSFDGILLSQYRVQRRKSIVVLSIISLRTLTM